MNTTTRLFMQSGLGAVLAAAAFSAVAVASRPSTYLLVVCLSVFITGLALLEAAVMKAIDRPDDGPRTAALRPAATA